METNFDAEETALPAPPAPQEAEPAGELAAEPVPEGLVASEDAAALETPPALDELGELAASAARSRLPAADEERLTALLKETLLSGRAGVARMVELLPTLPWIVGVRCVEQSWPELTAGFRTQLLAGLAKEDTEAARRIRLSLARALYKLEPAVALKLTFAVLKDLREKETGDLNPRNAQVISNVFIGRGRPWLAQLPLADLKPADIDLLVHCAILSVFLVPHPPVTQLGVLKWANDAERLDKLQASALEVVLKGLGRWNAKWQGALRREVTTLPEAIAAVLRPVPAVSAIDERDDREASEGEDSQPRSEHEIETSSEMGSHGDSTPEPKDEEDEENEEAEEGEGRARRERPVYEPRPSRAGAEEPRERENPRERPVYTPRHGGNAQGGGSQRHFSLTEALKGIEAHVHNLRTELAAAQARGRQKEERPRRPEKLGAIIEGEPTPEELARLNLQLEARNRELQARIDELAQHSEDVAASTGAMSGELVADGAVQMRTLLGFKLQEDYEDFAALEQESHDLVVQQHYRTIIQHIFSVLQEAQVPLHAASNPETR